MVCFALERLLRVSYKNSSGNVTLSCTTEVPVKSNYQIVMTSDIECSRVNLRLYHIIQGYQIVLTRAVHVPKLILAHVLYSGKRLAENLLVRSADMWCSDVWIDWRTMWVLLRLS